MVDETKYRFCFSSGWSVVPTNVQMHSLISHGFIENLALN